MPIIITSLLLFGTAGMLTFLRILRPQFRFVWLLAVAGSAAAWMSAWFWLPGLPIQFKIPLWQSVTSADSYAAFAITGTSWPYAVSLTTLALAFVLTAPARPDFPSPSTWALPLAGVGLGLLAAAAEGPLTLVLLWAGLDLLEVGVVLGRPEGATKRSHWPAIFALRLGSMAVVLLALVLGETGSSGTGFGAIQEAGAVFLPAASLLRLMALAAPGHPAADRDALRPVLHLIAGAAAVAFLSLLSPSIQAGSVLLSVSCAVICLYAGWMWFRAADISSGLRFWLVGMGSLVVVAALRANPLGATGWGNAMILAGSAIVLTPSGERWLKRLALFGIMICSGLPMTLAAALWQAGGGAGNLLIAPFMLAQALLLAGFFHSSWRGHAASPGTTGTRSLRGAYRLGSVLPLVVGLGLGLWGWPGASQLGLPAAAAVALLATGALALAKRRFSALSPSPMQWTPHPGEALLSAAGKEFGRFRDMLHSAAMTITRTLEGEAGILWSLVVLVVFVSLIADRTP